MDVNSDFETNLLLSSKKIIISVNEKSSFKNLYLNEIIFEDGKEISIKLINFFLEKNIFEIEKNLQNFIEKINLIIENDKFLNIQVSVKKNNYGEYFSEDKLIHLLNEAKDECWKTIDENRIVHMVIENYLVDKKNYSFFPRDLKCNTISIDVKFICLPFKDIKSIEEILKNYQISIDRVFNLNYVKSFLKNDDNDLFIMSMKLASGYNENEVSIVPKKPKNKGFFERFFDFFN